LTILILALGVFKTPGSSLEVTFTVFFGSGILRSFIWLFKSFCSGRRKRVKLAIKSKFMDNGKIVNPEIPEKPLVSSSI
jgi:hypothetical protein